MWERRNNQFLTFIIFITFYFVLNMSKAFFSARVFTGSGDHPWAEAVLIEGNVIAAVGSNDHVRQKCNENTVYYDLPGRFITPGLVDSHCHLLSVGQTLRMVNLRDLDSLEACLHVISQAVENAKPGQWIVGRCWNHHYWREKREPNRHDLDKIAPNNPIVMIRVCEHVCWVNSKALEIARITADTPDPAGGQIDREPGDYSPSGIIRETRDILERYIPEPAPDEQKQAMLDAQELFLKNGITCVHTCESLKEYEVVAAVEKEGNLKMRIYHLLPPDDLAEFDRRFFSNQIDNPKLWHGHTKLFADGSLGACTAHLHQPYIGSKTNVGIACQTPEQLLENIEFSYRMGRSVAIHAIGDKALTESINAISKARQRVPGDRRDRIEHMMLYQSEDLDRVKELNLTASIQPIFVSTDWKVAKQLWGENRCWNAHAWRSIENAGIPTIFGSDAPIEPVNPLLGIQAAMTRQDQHGQPASGWHPEQKLTLEAALMGFFKNAAWISNSEDKFGAIVPGKWADLSIFDQDLTTVPVHGIKDVKVEMTIVDGEIVYQK